MIYLGLIIFLKIADLNFVVCFLALKESILLVYTQSSVLIFYREKICTAKVSHKFSAKKKKNRVFAHSSFEISLTC